MGFFSRNRATTPQEPADTLGRGDVIPAAPTSMAGRLRAGGTAAVDKATQVYKQNPKLVGGLALVASALLLNKMRSAPPR